jgi:hypothetical protein
LEGHRSLLDHNFIVDTESFWDSLDGAHHDRVVFYRKSFLYWSRFCEDKVRFSKVDEPILEFACISEALNKLQDFSCHTTGNHSSGSSNGGNNLSSEHFRSMERAFVEPIVARSNIGSGMNKFNVEVRVIVLLKINGLNRLRVVRFVVSR